MLVAGSVSPIAVGPVINVVGVDNVILGVIAISVANFLYVFLFLRNDDDHAVDDRRRQRAGSDGGPTDDHGKCSTIDDDEPGLTGSVNR